MKLEFSRQFFFKCSTVNFQENLSSGNTAIACGRTDRHDEVNSLTPNDPYRGRTAPLTSKTAFYIFIQQIEVLNILNMVYTLRFFPLQNAVYFIILMYLVPVLFIFYIQVLLKLKNNSGVKRLIVVFRKFVNAPKCDITGLSSRPCV